MSQTTTLNLKAVIFKLCYQASRYYIWGWTLRRWSLFFLMGLLVLLGFNILSGGWPVFILVALLGMGLILSLWQAYRHQYIIFIPLQTQREGVFEPVELGPLLPFQPIPIRVTGTFTVEGKKRYYVDQEATYQVFETKERAIMLAVSPHRLLLLAKPHPSEVGWWYAFFQPEAVLSIVEGTMFFGWQSSLVVQLRYQTEAPESSETFYISFANETQQNQFLRDLSEV